MNSCYLPGREKTALLLESYASGENSQSYRFSGCERIIQADSPGEVVAAFADVEQAVAQGKHAAGFVSYEAASGLNTDLPVQPKGSLPLVWFGVFTGRFDCRRETPVNATGNVQLSPPELSIGNDEYVRTVAGIRDAIARGETYQVNFTTSLRFIINGDPFALYRRMCLNQQAPYCAWLDIGTHRILSASPELFFSLKDGRLTMKPMKGTAPRRPRVDDDRRQRDVLAENAKDRAENLMIVDMIRNDLSQIAKTGTVQVESLFDVETYPTVHQMTSTISARIRPETGLTDIFRALFPCGSVTGAPKRHTMKIIRDVETQPRGVYCGAIGYFSPGREAAFSVAIRTAVVESATGRAELGIGSGITWDSDAADELQECLDKGAFLMRDSSEFCLIESFRFDNHGYLLLDRHLQRLKASAAYFGFVADFETIKCRLHEWGRGLSGIHKVRLQLARDGSSIVESRQIEKTDGLALVAEIALSDRRVDSSDPFLYHKTTRRNLYDEELQAYRGCYDVIFLNERGELTEGSFNTIVISRKGEMLTPQLDSGLLPGVLREELLEVGVVREALLTLDDLHAAEKIWLINSVRGWRECIITTKSTSIPLS